MNKKRETLNYELLTSVKRAFVAMPGGDPGPVAGGGMLTQAQAAPMGGAPMDPSMGGMPPDPAAMGGMPPDPAAMGGAPMDPSMGGAPMDPSMGGMPPELAGLMGGGGEGQVSMSSAEFTDLLVTLITTLGGGKAPKPKAEGGGEAGASGAAPSAGGAGVEAKLDQVITLLGGGAPQPGMM